MASLFDLGKNYSTWAKDPEGLARRGDAYGPGVSSYAKSSPGLFQGPHAGGTSSVTMPAFDPAALYRKMFQRAETPLADPHVPSPETDWQPPRRPQVSAQRPGVGIDLTMDGVKAWMRPARGVEVGVVNPQGMADMMLRRWNNGK